MKKLKLPAIFVPLMIVGAMIIGIMLGNHLPGHRIIRNAGAQKINEILDLIEDEYVDHVDLDSLINESIPAILANLDPHTAYIPAEDFDEVNSELEGSFSGIGIQFNLTNDTITVLEVISGGPSEKVGLRAGDRIVQVNDSNLIGSKIKTDDVMNLLRGPKDTTVKLGIKRAGSPSLLTYTVTRGDIPVTSIDASYMIEPGVGYIKVNKFGRNTYREFFIEMMMLRAEGAKKYILDLRGNSGGFLDVAIQMANEFLDRGREIVSTRGRDGELQSRVGADGSGTFKDEELVVLIDEFSASASEIVAGAMQDNDRATIIGRRSFGKGLVQKQHDLSDGSAIRVTTARYYTPSGRCIQKPFKKGDVEDYQLEIYDRYLSGEAFNADSVKTNRDLLFHTVGGREVYGGGGIMPDIFVPSDTTNINAHYTDIFNSGLIHRFAFEYADSHRSILDGANTADEVIATLPSDGALLQEFANYMGRNKLPPRWYYLNLSRPLLVNQLKALIARNVLGTAAYYEIANTRDKVVNRALESLKNDKTSNGQAGNSQKNT